jgi:nuclear protein localization protein 4 homolog
MPPIITPFKIRYTFLNFPTRIQSLSLVRVSSRQGIKRYQVSADTTLEELARMIEKDMSIPLKDQRLSIRPIPGRPGAGSSQTGSVSATTFLLTEPGQRLGALGLANGDLIYLESPETSLTPEEIQEQMQMKLGAALPAPIASPKQVEHHHNSITAKDVIEDDIDIFLRKQDGWVPRKRSRYCTHPQNGSCGHCMPIAPWAITGVEEFESLGLKHIPYHGWLREKYYTNPNNPVILDDPVYKVEISASGEKGGGPSASASDRMSVTLERQPYRHVDHVEFDNPAIVDRFIAGWRETGRQRLGYMFGRYIPDVTLPLGIRALVSAIYEPPQQSGKDSCALLKDQDDALVDELCSSLGLAKIGVIWTSLLVDDQRKIVPDRDFETVHLKSQECIRMGRLQSKYPSPCKESTTGTFGSKFCSVLVYGNKEGDIEISAWQLSNQITRLIRDGAVRDAKEPQFLKSRPSKDGIIYPDVFYRHKNEYGFFVNSKAAPNFPVEYALVSLRHSFPKDPQPLFKSVDFPIENRPAYQNAPTGAAVLAYLQNLHGATFVSRLTDFHLLLFLKKYVDKQTFALIHKAVTQPGSVIETEIRPRLEAQWAASQPAAPKPAAAAPSGNSASKGSDPAAARQQEMISQLTAMGYPADQAQQALWATNYVSVENALDLLLSQM